jgi:Na+/proline symporter
MFICLYFLGIILMGLYWKNHRADDKRQAWVALLAFVAVNSLSFALSCTFFAFKLDFLMDGLATRKRGMFFVYPRPNIAVVF